MVNMGSIPKLGVGIGLRAPHVAEVLGTRPAIGWFEVHAENYMAGGPPLAALEQLRADYPLSVHGVGLSLGSAAALDTRHLARLKTLLARLEPALVSEHLAWSMTGGIYLNHLLPLPYTEETLDIVVQHVRYAQEVLQGRLLIENPSSYLRFAHSVIPEPEFLGELVRRTGCGLLCDVNNIYVSCCNLGGDPVAYLEALPARAVGEIHLAGYAVNDADGQTIFLARCPPCSSGTRISQTWLCCVAKPTRPSGTSSVPRRRSMPALRDLQSAFLRAMLGPDEPQLLEALVGDGLLPTVRLQMYRHHVLTSLTEVLQVTFPVICRLVDERFFRYAADAYIRQSPPEAPCLFEYGAHFPAFLATFPPCRALVYLADVARLEWALNDQIWRANQADADVTAAVIDLRAGGVCLEIFRWEDAVGFRTLAPPVYAFRAALAAGYRLDMAAEAALAAEEDFDVVHALADLLADGSVRGWTRSHATRESASCNHR